MRLLLRAGRTPSIAAGAALLLGACAPFRGAPPPPGASPPADPVALRIVYVIHGDGSYSFHDSTGTRLLADREALRQAREVAERARDAEVFLFHQRPVRAGLFRRDPGGRFHHYRAGALVRSMEYSRAGAALEAEARLLGLHAAPFPADSEPPQVVLAYFGHEIPLRDGARYSASLPRQPLSVARFAEGLARMNLRPGSPGKPFDLVVLSVCYGGTPALLEALAPLADEAVASPAYLHLSFLDTRALADFADGAAGRPPRPGEMADTLALRSYEGLASRTQTEITVAAYDLEEARAFLSSPVALAQRGAMGTAWRDCALLPGFDSAAAARGVRLHYRPPRFGPLKDRLERSGWQCADP